MKKTLFSIKSRKLSTKPKKLRGEGILPGNLFGPKFISQAVKFDLKKFIKLYKLIGEAAIVYLKLEKKEIPAMIDEVQLDPVTDKPIHASFKVVSLKEKVEANIPVRFEGEFEVAEAVLVRVRDEIEVEALPVDLPEEFVVNVAGLKEVGQSITIADLKYDEAKVEIVIGEEGVEAPIVLVQEMEEEKEEEEEEIETKIIGEEEKEEGLEEEGGEDSDEKQVVEEDGGEEE
ncbi:MAG: 50S ribosomal protein L25 [Patescibacteria group bacterium]|nr:50S ribosomal protein L25 [Patescibacteria group bacterium]